MKDYLQQTMEPADIKRMSSLALAHIGDAVYEIMVRTLLACKGTQTAANLHRKTTRLVCAGAQCVAAKHIMPLLDEEELTVLKQGRNAKPKSAPHTASSAEYAYATALEALFGYLYLNGRYDRLNALFDEITTLFQQKTP